MMVAFIDEHRDGQGVESICKTLPIAPSTYYEQKAKRADPMKRSSRQKRDATLRMQSSVWNNHSVYGTARYGTSSSERAMRSLAVPSSA